jgi:hypothetical protein
VVGSVPAYVVQGDLVNRKTELELDLTAERDVQRHRTQQRLEVCRW